MCLKLLSWLIFLVAGIAAFQEINDDEYTIVSTSQRPSDEHSTKLEERLRALENSNQILQLQNVQMQKSLEKLDFLLRSSSRFPRHCKEVQERGNNVSGFFFIQPELSNKSFPVLCDMKTRGGGWTYFHNRFDGSQEFFLGWNNYKEGFGHLGGEFWLGLENLYRLIGYQTNELLVELVDWDLKKVHAYYSAFIIGSDSEGYSLKVLGEYNGDAGDSLIYHVGSKFSTKNRDQDSAENTNCANDYLGAWWYKGCMTSSLNAKYERAAFNSTKKYTMFWNSFHGGIYSLKQARMMVRPRDNSSPVLLPHEREKYT